MKIAHQSIYSPVIKDRNLPDIEAYVLNENKFITPDNEFILCRQADGKPTAVYGDMSWNFNPYNLSAEYITILNFDFFNEVTPLSLRERMDLIDEMKRIMFLLIYCLPDMGRIGILSIKVLSKRFYCLKNVALYCEVIKEKYSLNNKTISMILSSDVYLADFIKTLSANQKSEFSDLLINLNRLDTKLLGFNLTPFYEARPSTLQTPIIPSRIYFATFSKLTKEVEMYWAVKEKLTSLISEFTSQPVGRDKETNRVKYKIYKPYPELNYLIKRHKLNKFFVGSYQLKDKRNLVSKLINIQLTCKYVIHLYTAMRNSEALRIPYDCVKNIDISTDDLVKETNYIPKRFVHIVSTTTKFSGYRKQAGWLCPEAAVKAIDTLKAISEGMAFLFNVKPSSLPLFQSLSFIVRGKVNVGKVTNFSKKSPYCLIDLNIQQTDKEELMASDATRVFDEPYYEVGQKWLYSSHQFRRSLAFFGANSNLMSESTGAILFKHLTLEMQRYYRKGFNKLISVFGCFNKETGEIDIHQDHFLFEYRTGISIEKAREIIHLLFKDRESLYGKKGNYIERQRENLSDDDVNLIELKTETERQAMQGEIAYKKTLLGGCMKLDHCEDHMLGNFTACIDCDDAFIRPIKLNEIIERMENDIHSYKNGTGEYQQTKYELEKLIVLRDKELQKRERYV